MRRVASAASGGVASSRHSWGVMPRDAAAAFLGVRFAGARLTPEPDLDLDARAMMSNLPGSFHQCRQWPIFHGSGPNMNRRRGSGSTRRVTLDNLIKTDTYKHLSTDRLAA